MPRKSTSIPLVPVPAPVPSSSGQKLGYVRVSSLDQNVGRQLDGETVDKTFTDKASGKDTSRPELLRLVEYAREGDEIVVHSMDRLARNLDDLRSLVRRLTDKGVRVRFIKEGLVFDGTSNPMSQLLLSVMGAFAEFERSLILERQREGIALAKAAGKYKGRTPALSPEQAQLVREQCNNGVPKARVARELQVSRNTIYAALR